MCVHVIPTKRVISVYVRSSTVNIVHTFIIWKPVSGFLFVCVCVCGFEVKCSVGCWCVFWPIGCSFGDAGKNMYTL